MLCCAGCAVLVDAGSDLVMSHAQVYDVTDRLLLSTMRNLESWLSVSHSVTPLLQALALTGCLVLTLAPVAQHAWHPQHRLQQQLTPSHIVSMSNRESQFEQCHAMLLLMQDANCFFGTDHKDLVSSMAGGVTSIGCSGPVIGPDKAARAATAAYNSPLRLVDVTKVPPSSVTLLVNAPWDGGNLSEVSPRIV